jgi:DNA-binding winged helix-turn-helix (wHTH) protein
MKIRESQTPEHRLNRTTKNERIQRLWQKASRHHRRGDGALAASTWKRMLGVAGQRGGAHHGFGGDVRLSAGPPVSPMLRPPATDRDMPRLVLSMGGTRHVLPWVQADRALEVAKLDLVVDMVRKQVVHRGQSIEMHGREIPLKILATLLRDRSTPISDRDLFLTVWERPLRSAYDIRTLYFHIHQIRKMMPETEGCELILRTADGYLMRSAVRGVILESAKMPEGLDRRSCILNAAKLIGHVDTRSVCELTGVSSTTGFRELRSLVQEGLLRPIGSGRGARYLPIQEAA